MSVNLRMYTSAVYAFDHVLKSAKPTAYTRKSPCVGWTGKNVYEHGLGNLTMINSIARTGKGPKSRPKMGTDSLGAWLKLRDQTLEALDHPHVVHAIAQDPFGPQMGSMPVDAVLALMAADLTTHTWDMARTAKVDERLDPALVKFSQATWNALPMDAFRKGGAFGPAIKPAKGADAQTKLLNFLGRTV